MLGALGVAAVWILGGKQREYSTGLEIKAAPESVFYLLTNPDAQKKWSSGLEVVGQYTSAENSSVGETVKTARVVKDAAGNQTTFEDQVIRFEQNKSLSVQSVNSSGVMTSIYQLEAKDGQTYLTYRVKQDHTGLGRFWAPLVEDNTQLKIDGDIRKLKEIAETSSVASMRPTTKPANTTNTSSDEPSDLPTFSF